MYTVAPSSVHWHKQKRWRPRPYALEALSCRKMKAFENFSLNQEHGDGALEHHQLRKRSSWSNCASTGGAALMVQSNHSRTWRCPHGTGFEGVAGSLRLSTRFLSKSKKPVCDRVRDSLEGPPEQPVWHSVAEHAPRTLEHWRDLECVPRKATDAKWERL